MENLDLTVLRTLRDWRLEGMRALMATVVRTWGSSPRPVGSIMALREDGAVVGSVSGGCIEDDLIYRYTFAGRGRSGSSPMPSGPPACVRYGLSGEEAHRFGLPCGGTLELILEVDPDADELRALVAALDRGELVQRALRLADGQSTISRAHVPATLKLDENVLIATFGPAYRMLLIGAGQITEYVASMANFSGFDVTVCDPREEYLRNESLAGVRWVSDMPDDAVVALRPDRRTCVIALTHDPKLDDLALMAALETDAFYIGAIGSRRNNEARRERLRMHFGVTPQALRRLRGPVGLYIGSKTPAEIAVSVMAEVIAVKNGVTLTEQMDVAYAKQSAEVPSTEVACSV